MNTYSENIFLAHNLLQKVKQQTISSNDIIPKVTLPVLPADCIQNCMTHFGTEKMTAYLDNTSHSRYLRNIFLEALQNRNLKYGMTAATLAVARSGTGEASELVNSIYVNLLKRSLQNFTIVYIESEPNQNLSHPHPFNHAFILLGSASFLNENQDIIARLHQNQHHLNSYNHYLELQEEIVQTEMATKTNPQLRWAGALRLTNLDMRLALLRDDMARQYPQTPITDLKQFLKQLVQENYTFYQKLMTDPDMVVLDPLLNFVGNLRDYQLEQKRYFTTFKYCKIRHIETPALQRDFAAHLAETEAVVEELVSAAKQTYHPFDRNLLDLPLCAYPYLEKTDVPAKDNPESLKDLSHYGALPFAGLRAGDQIDAVVEVKTDEDRTKAQAIQNRLATGNFYSTATQTFFVVPKVNIQGMPEKIQHTLSNLHNP